MDINNPFDFSGLTTRERLLQSTIARNQGQVLGALHSPSFANMQAERQAIIERNMAANARIQDERERYGVTSGDMTQANFFGGTLAKTQNFAASAWDATTHIASQAVGAKDLYDAVGLRSQVSDRQQELYAKYKKNPKSLNSFEMAELNKVVNPSSTMNDLFSRDWMPDFIEQPRTAMEYMQSFDKEFALAQQAMGNKSKGKAGVLDTETFNPYFRNLRDEEVRRLNDKTAENYKGRIAQLEAAGDTQGALKLAAEMNKEFLKNAVKGNAKHNDALIGEVGAMVPQIALGMASLLGTAGLQAAEDYTNSLGDYMTREGKTPTGSDGWKMAGLAGLNLGANFVEGVTALKALKMLKGSGKAVTESVEQGSKAAQVAKAGLAGAGVIAGVTAANFVAGGLQDSIQRGWGSLSTDGVDSRSFIEAGVIEGMIAGGIIAAGKTGGAVTTTAGLAKDAINAGKEKTKQRSYEEYLGEEHYNPAEAVRTQVDAFSAPDTTPEQQTKAEENIRNAIDVAETKMQKINAEFDALRTQAEETIAATDEDTAQLREQLKQITDPAMIEEINSFIQFNDTKIEREVTKLEQAKQIRDEQQVFLDDALKVYSDFDQGRQANAGQTNTPEVVQQVAETVTAASDPNSPEVQKAVDHVRNYPMLQTPEKLMEMSKLENAGFTQNEQGLMRRLAEQQIDLNSVKSTGNVSREIVDGGPTFKGLKQYVSDMSEALRLENAKTQERLINSISDFESNMQQKEQAALSALELAKKEGKQQWIYKDQKNGNWLINKGEVQINDSNRAELGALFINPNSEKSVGLVDEIKADARRVTEAKAILQQMQEVRNQLTTRKASVQQREPIARPVKEVTPDVQPQAAVPATSSTPVAKQESNTAAVPTQPTVQQKENSVPSVVKKPRSVKTQKRINRADLKANQDTLYIFGDNDIRRGLGGQAKEMRGEPNAVGVRTKATPSMDANAFWSDATYEDNIKKIDADLKRAFEHDGPVVVPEDGIGTGLSQLEKTAPRTYAYLQNRMLELVEGKPKNSITENTPAKVSTSTREIPRVQVGKDPNSFTNVNAQVSRDIADKRGLTQEIEDLFAEGFTARQVRDRMNSKLGFLDVTERPGFITQVRASMGIPSRMSEEDHDAFDQWKADYDKRKATSSVLTEVREALRGVETAPDSKATPPVESELSNTVPEVDAEVVTTPEDAVTAPEQVIAEDVDAMPEGQGKLSIFAGHTKESRAEERKLPFEEQNLVRTGFTQKIGDGFLNPLLHTPQFMSTIRGMDKAERKAYIDQFVREDVTDDHMKSVDALSDFMAAFAPLLEKTFSRNPNKAFHYEDFMQFLVQDDAKGNPVFDENLLTAMSAGAFTWFAENGAKPVQTPDQILENIFHFRNMKGQHVTEAIANEFGHASNMSAFAQALGERVVQSLGLKVLSDVGANRQGKLEASIGINLVYALERLGYVEIFSKTQGEMAAIAKGLGPYKYRDWLKGQLKATAVYAEATGRTKIDYDRAIQNLPHDPKNYDPVQRTLVNSLEQSKRSVGNFVRMYRDEEGQPLKVIEDLMDSVKGEKGTGGFLSRLFSVGKERVGPTTEKPKPITKLTPIKGTPLHVPSLQAARMNNQQDRAYRVRTEAYEPIAYLHDKYKDDLVDLFGLHHSKEYLEANVHVTRRNSVAAKAEAVLRDMDNALGFIRGSLTKDENGEYQNVYMSLNVVRTQRMGVDNNDLNTQANQVHRTFVTPSDYKTEVPVLDKTELKIDDLYTDGELNKLGAFLRTVGEHAEELKLNLPSQYVGATVDKVAPRDYLTGFLEWYNKPEVQDAITATVELMDAAKNAKPIDKSVFTRMSYAINGNPLDEKDKGMGMGIQSYNALVSLAEYQIAQKNKQTSVSTYLRAGSDGKTSGSAIASTMSGTVDASTGNNTMSDGFGLITKQSHKELQFSNQYDVAAAGLGDLYNTINTFQSKRWESLFSANMNASSNPDLAKYVGKLATAMDERLFGGFDKRAKGKTIASPTIYGSGTEAIKQNAVAEGIDAIYKKMQDIAGKDPEVAKVQLETLRADLNSMIQYHNTFLVQIPKSADFGKWRDRLEYDYNLKNPDSPKDFSEMSDEQVMRQILGNKFDINLGKSWGKVQWQYNKDRNVAAVNPIPASALKVDSLLDTELDFQARAAIESVLYNTHGRVHELALQDAYKDYLQIRDVNIAISKVAYVAYKELKDSLFTKALNDGMDLYANEETRGNAGAIPFKLDKQGNRVAMEGLSKQVMEKLELQLRNSRPVVASALSVRSDDPIGTGIMLTDTRNVSSKKAHDTVNVRIMSKTLEEQKAQGKSKVQANKVESGIAVQEDADPGVRASVFTVLGSDAGMSSAAMGADFGVENMHDANYANINNIAELGRLQNEEFHTIAATYHLQVETLNMMMRALNEVAKGTSGIPDSGLLAIQEAFDALQAKAFGPTAKDSPEVFLEKLAEQRFQLEKNKFKYLDSLYAVHNYGSYGAEVVLTEKHQKMRDESLAKLETDWHNKAKRRATRVGKELGLLFKGEAYQREASEVPVISPAEELLNKAKDRPLAAKDVVAGLRAQTLSPAQKALLDALDPLLPEGLSFNYFNAGAVPKHVADKDSAVGDMLDKGAAGWYSPEANQINITEGNASTELVLHELLHAGLSRAVAAVKANPSDPKLAKVKAAVDRLEALRAEVAEALKAKNITTFDEAVKDVDELISWGMSNKAFQKFLAARTTKLNGRQVTSMFKSFVKNIVDAVMGQTYRSSKRLDIPYYEALVMDVATIAEEVTALEKDGPLTSLKLEAKPMITGRDQAREKALRGSPREIYDALDGSTNSPEFAARVSALMDSVVDKVISRTGREHLKNGLEQHRPDFSEDAIKAGFDLNEKEAYAVAALEAAIDTGLDTGAGSAVFKVMTEAFNEARQTMKVETFHQGDWKTASAQDKLLAKSRYDYVFKPNATGGRNIALARFAALTLGSEYFNGLTGFSNPAAEVQQKSMLKRIGDAVEYVLDWVTNLLAGTQSNAAVNAKVAQLVERIATIDMHARHKAVVKFEQSWDAVVNGFQRTGTMTAAVLEKVGNSDFVQNSRFSGVRAMGKVAKLSLDERMDNVPGNLKKARDFYNPNTRLGPIAEALSEFRGAEGFAKVLQQLLRGTKEIEKARTKVKESVQSVINDSFSRKHTKAEAKGLAYGLIYSGAHVLLGEYSTRQVRDLMAQESYRQKEVTRLQNIVLKHPRGNAMLIHIRQLGWFTQTGKPTPGVPTNALAIAQEVVSPAWNGQLQEVDPALVDAIDKLATLYGFEYMDADNRSNALRVIDEELKRTDGVNGFENTLKMHKHLHDDAMANRFKDNPLNAIKGWAPELTNPYIDTRVADLADKAVMEAKGWKYVGELPKDARDNIQRPQAMYIIKDGGNQRRVSGVLSMLDSHTKGLVVSDGAKGEQTASIKADLSKRIAQIERMDFRQYDPRTDQSTQLFATYDTEGKVLSYSYRMEAATRDSLLQRKHNIAEMLGEYAGTSLDKIRSPEQNQKTMQALYEDYADNYMKSPRAYTEIGPKAKDTGARELWRLLPHETKIEMEKLWGKDKSMWIRNDLVNLTFGYKKLAAGNIWNKQEDARNWMEKTYVFMMEFMFREKAQLRAYQGGRIVDEAVATAKDWIVLRTVGVLWGNIKANFALMMAFGIAPTRIYQDSVTAFKAGRAYEKDYRELIRIEQQLRSGIGNTAELEARYAQVQDAMARNPLKDFIEAGTMPSIVDDVETDTDDFSYKSAVMEKIEKPLNMVPGFVRKGAATVLMQQGTIGHNFLSSATQYSDFVGRYVVYKHSMEKGGMSHAEAIHEAMEIFINYGLPSSPEVQWLNDTGVFMFTRFLFRYQRILNKLMRNNPALVLTQSMLLGAVGSETVLDPNILSKNISFLSPGAFVLPSAISGSTPMGLVF